VNEGEWSELARLIHVENMLLESAVKNAELRDRLRTLTDDAGPRLDGTTESSRA
jgi:hypothetical protein